MQKFVVEGQIHEFRKYCDGLEKLTALLMTLVIVITVLRLLSGILSSCVAVEFSSIILASEQVWSTTHLQARWLPDACCRAV